MFEINGLKICLFFRRFKEAGKKQGKIPDAGKLSADLSTETVDRFGLALAG
ncbi:hypothetical protein [Shimia sp. SDUM112013]|uniref:hypothetical protein n=1 Tax=Shimia sp. SDUM112013 TaxID=3136160 RepID=UPI0032EADEBE